MGAGAAERLPTIWRIPDDLWLIVQYVLPREELQRSRGRPWIPARHILDAVLYVLRTGCQWKAVPREFGSGSTVHRRFQRWVERGVWEAMWRLLLQYYDAAESLEWTWQSADASLHKAPLGGGKNGAQPDRPREDRDQAPHPHRRRGGADRGGDHGRQYA
jgi:putative transposase